MKKLKTVLIGILLVGSIAAQGYQPGDEAIDFNLKNIDGKMVSMKNMKDAKGFIVIFSCNHCPYVVAYEDRMVELDKTFKTKGFPVIAINPNDPESHPTDSYENMQKRAKEKGFTFPYLVDNTQEIAKTYGATRTPHVYLLAKEKGKYIVKYIGAIDDNYQDADAVKEKYLANAIEAVIAKKEINPLQTKAIGCSIKWKKK